MIKPIKSMDKDACDISAQGGMCCYCDLCVWSVLMLMLCSFLQFGICRALEYLISHLITPGQLSRDTPYQGRGWNFVKIFSISERLTQQWNVSLWNYINSHHYVGAVCFLQSPVPLWTLSSHFPLRGNLHVKLPLSGRRVVPGQCGRGRVTRAAASQGGGWPGRVTLCHPVIRLSDLYPDIQILISCPEVCAGRG